MSLRSSNKLQDPSPTNRLQRVLQAGLLHNDRAPPVPISGDGSGLVRPMGNGVRSFYPDNGALVTLKAVRQEEVVHKYKP